ncbi:MAG: hypothetical protein AAB308_10375, partial [Nitrospirota bacterium]
SEPAPTVYPGDVSLTAAESGTVVVCEARFAHAQRGPRLRREASERKHKYGRWVLDVERETPIHEVACLLEGYG